MNKASFLFLLAALLFQCTTPTTTTPPPTPCPCPCPPTPTETGANAEQFFGTCCFPWTPVQKMGAFTNVRAYVSADFISTAQGIFVEPIWKARTDPAEGLDSWIAALNANGCTPIICVNQTPEWFWGNAIKRSAALGGVHTYDPHGDLKAWMAQGGKRAERFVAEQLSPEHPPVKPGASRTDPESYATYARIFGELAKRYGSKKFPPESLWVNSTPRWTNDPPNQKVSGLNLKVGFEVWNEPDKWWRLNDGSGVYMQPEEYAALFAACYAAVKQVDTSLQVYNAGFTGFDRSYMERFIAALKAMGKPMPDAFTVHHYSHAGNNLGQWPPTWWDGGACAPELDKDFAGVLPLVELAKANGRELWVTEFGVDTRGPSWMWAKPVAGKNSEQLQSEWLLRTMLEYMRVGVGRAMLFNANDEAGALNGGLYVNSGILYGEGEPGKIFAPKPAYATLVAAVAELKGLRFIKEESTPTARIMRFEGGGKTVWAYWKPTADGTVADVVVAGTALQAKESVQFKRAGQ